MKAEQVDKALHQKFITEDSRLVFWHDPNSEFAEYVADGLSGETSGVQILDVAKLGGFSTKLLLEKEDPTGKYLIYTSGDAPDPEHDWLLDIRLYSDLFHADVASLWLQELGLSQLALRDHLKAREVFFGSQERRKKLQRHLSTAEDEASLDLKMMAVLVGSSVANPLDILRGLCHDHAASGEFDLLEPPKLIGTFEKMGLVERFWDLMQGQFSYSSDTPRLGELLRKLLVSELFHQTDGARLDSLAQHLLPDAGRRNAGVFLSQWRDTTSHALSFEAVSTAVANEQDVDGALVRLELESLKDVYTFWEAEKRIIHELKGRLLDQTHAVDVRTITQIAKDRQAGYWLAGPQKDQTERAALSDAYDALVAAAEFFALHAAHRGALSFDTAEALLTKYKTELFQFDRLYRRFRTRCQGSQEQGSDLLKELATEIERAYNQGFVDRLGLEWSRLLDRGFLSEWSLKGFPNQQNFYATEIATHLNKQPRNRAFVIISDAFRYEAASELVEQLNSQDGMNAELSAMLGVLPSYTALGMASLLPHETLDYTDKDDIVTDGRTTSGTENRSKQLAEFGGMACQSVDLSKMKTAEAREFTEGSRVVYIYHNVIDAIGDKVATEGKTFEAVTTCLKELLALVQFCVNKLNAGKVWITADHGFLYQEKAPGETDKSRLSREPESTVTKKKRYIVGRELGTVPEAHQGSIGTTAGIAGEMEFWIPRSASRFHFAGGARFVHGGAMPQEIVVPLVTMTQLRGKKKESSLGRKVSVQVLGTSHKITAPKYRFEIIQTEPVSDRRKPLTLRAAIYDDKGRAVSTIETLTFESASTEIADRMKSLLLDLLRESYDKRTEYQLVLRDADTDANVFFAPVVIDRSFTDDF